MTLPRFLVTVLLLTCLCLVYVWQQTTIYSLAYDGQKKVACFQELLDENSVLRYNLKKDTSLVRLGAKISHAGDFQMPNSYCLVRLTRPEQATNIAVGPGPARQSFLSRLLGARREALGKTISPSFY